MGDMWDIAAKRMRQSFSRKRFLMVLILFLVLSLGSVYTGAEDYQRQEDRYLDPSNTRVAEPTFLQIFEPLTGFSMGLVAGLLGILISYNTISKERRDGTIEILLSYPLYRDEIINGKIIANIFIVAFALLIAGTAASGLAIYLIDAIPTIEETSRLGLLWFGTAIYITFFIGIGTLFSTLFRSQWRSLATAALLLLLFTGTPFLASMAASQIYEMPDREPAYGPRPGHGDVVIEREAMTGRRATGSASGSASSSSSAEAHVEESTGDEVEVRPMPGPDRDRDRESIQRERDAVRDQRQQFVNTVSRLSPSTTYTQFTENMLGTRFASQEGVRPTIEESLATSLDILIYLISQVALVFTATYTVFLRQDL